MRAFLLALALGLLSLGSLALVPARVEAREWHSGDNDTYAVRWHGYRGWHGGSHYRYGRYGWGGYGYRGYYPRYRYRYGYYPGYYRSYYYPGYASYPYGPMWGSYFYGW